MINERVMHTVLACLLGVFAPMALPAQMQHRMTVDELFTLVESNNNSLRSQKTGIEIANHGITVAKSERLPDVKASLAFTYYGNVLMTDRDFSDVKGMSAPHYGNSFALEAQQTVYAGGAIDAGIRLAELQKRQSEEGVRQTRAQQRFMALGMYLDLFKINNSIRVYEKNISLTEKLIADIKAKQTQGMALKNDVTRYELQMETLRLGLKKQQDLRAIQNHQLCNALGLTGEEIQPDTTIINNVYGKDGETSWQNRAAASSPVLRQSELGVQQANQQLKLAKSDMLPKVFAFAADNFSGPFINDIPPIDKNFNFWYVGVGVNYSLSSLFKSNKKLRQAKVATRQSMEQHTVAAEAIDNQVQQAYTLYEQSYVELQTQQKNVQLSNQNYQVVNDRYLNQLALITDMLDASNIKLNAELQEVDARINIVYAYYKMKYITGEI